MSNDSTIQLWNEAWSAGLWAASWAKAVEGLSAQQAAWKPSPRRHSIWQIVGHMIFWREEALRRLAGQARTPEDQVAARNFPDPTEVSESAWSALRGSLEETHKRIAAAYAARPVGEPKLAHILAHDCYHMGQVAYLRALQGLPPLD